MKQTASEVGVGQDVMGHCWTSTWKPMNITVAT